MTRTRREFAHSPQTVPSERAFVRATLATWLQYLEKSPNDVQILLGVGAAYGILREYTPAASFFARAVSADPQSAEAHVCLAGTYGCLGFSELEVESCLRALLIEPHQPDAFALLGAGLTKLERFDEAIAAFESALEYGDTNPSTRALLGKAYAAKGQLGQAMDQADALTRMRTREANALRRELAALIQARESSDEG